MIHIILYWCVHEHKYKPLRINILDSFNGAMDKNTIEYIHTECVCEREKEQENNLWSAQQYVIHCNKSTRIHTC